VELRDLRETIRDSLVGLVGLGRLKPQHAGKAMDVAPGH
jgi:hypothetical protein